VRQLPVKVTDIIILDDVRQLPVKVTDIYRRITT